MDIDLLMFYLNRCGRSLVELSNVIGVTFEELNFIISGKNEPSRGEMILMSHYLKLTIDEVLQLFRLNK